MVAYSLSIRRTARSSIPGNHRVKLARIIPLQPNEIECQANLSDSGTGAPASDSRI